MLLELIIKLIIGLIMSYIYPIILKKKKIKDYIVYIFVAFIIFGFATNDLTQIIFYFLWFIVAILLGKRFMKNKDYNNIEISIVIFIVFSINLVFNFVNIKNTYLPVLLVLLSAFYINRDKSKREYVNSLSIVLLGNIYLFMLDSIIFKFINFFF